jgi:hypothetical protein
MIIYPELFIDGVDVSAFFISCHAEQTANSTKDPGKYDLVIANVGGKFLGAFAPKNYYDGKAPEGMSNEEALDQKVTNFTLAPKKKVTMRVRKVLGGCAGEGERTITIFNGELQKCEADELFLRIEGSCSEGGMTAYMKIPKIWSTEKGDTVSTVVNDILDLYGFTGVRHIMPLNDDLRDLNFEIGDRVDFDTAMYLVAQVGESIYFYDEVDEFWFVPPYALRGLVNLDGHVLLGTNAANMVQYCTHVDVYGASPEDVSERKQHNVIYAYADVRDDPATAWEHTSYGFMKAPPVYLPTADYATCKKTADNLLKWYRQYRDVTTVKLTGIAPGLLSEVTYHAWNGKMPPTSCDTGEGAEFGAVVGLVTKRVVDISAEAGFVCTLEVATSAMNSGVPIPSDDYDKAIAEWFAKWQAKINADNGIENKNPGVLLV